MQISVWSLPALAACALLLLSLTKANQYLSAPGGRALRVLSGLAVAYALAILADTLLLVPEGKRWAQVFAFCTLSLIPLAWFQFAVTYAQRNTEFSTKILLQGGIIPLALIILALTNPWHNLVWQDWNLKHTSGFATLWGTYGPAAWAAAVYGYAVLLMAVAILGFALAQYQQRENAVSIAAATVVIIALAQGYSGSAYNSVPWLDFTPLGLAMALLFQQYGIIATGPKSLPVVRDRVVEQLSDPVLVVTHQGEIIDANQSAHRSWATDEQPLLSRPVGEIIQHLPLDRLLGPSNHAEVTINEQSFEIASTTLDSNNAAAEVALVFRDVTERRRNERQLTELKDELERLAHTDALTNLFNRRYFMQRLGEEFERVRRHDSNLSVLIFDLDHFKRINDSYGHDVGDAVLVAISNVANQIKRLTDVACRLGGEEFALLLPETDRKGAIHVAQRLRRGIEEFPYSELVHPGLNVTASVGVSTISPRVSDPNGILKVADTALYKAKNGGRNMVCFEQA